MAWYGTNPLSDENTRNVKTYYQEGTGVIITVVDPKNPLVGGYGFGFRSRLLGYFCRLDFGWGVDALRIQKRIVSFSLATDF
jgi:hypothetical protein